MTMRLFDAITRRATDDISHRASFLALGGASIPALAGRPAARAKNNIGKKARCNADAARSCRLPNPM